MYGINKRTLSIVEGKTRIAARAWELVQAGNLTAAQIDIVALSVATMVRRAWGDQAARLLLLVMGAGGTGKTHGPNKVLRP